MLRTSILEKNDYLSLYKDKERIDIIHKWVARRIVNQAFVGVWYLSWRGGHRHDKRVVGTSAKVRGGRSGGSGALLFWIYVQYKQDCDTKKCKLDHGTEIKIMTP